MNEHMAWAILRALATSVCVGRAINEEERPRGPAAGSPGCWEADGSPGPAVLSGPAVAKQMLEWKKV